MYIKPNKEKLSELIYRYDFVRIAKILNVKSKTTIVRWCKYYGLPYKKEELQHQRFINRLNNINPNIEVIEKYKSARDNIKVKCKICNNEWEPTPDSLLHNHGCPCCNGTSFTHDYFVKIFKEKKKRFNAIK